MIRSKVTIVVLLMTTLGMGLGSFTCIANVPQEVQKAFDKKYSSVEVVQWKYGPDNTWIADFSLHKIDYLAKFSPDGSWIETKSIIHRKKIPESVKLKTAKNYEKHKIERAIKIETKKGVFYKLWLRKGKKISEFTTSL